MLTKKFKLENFNIYCITQYALKNITICLIFFQSLIAFTQINNINIHVVSGTKIKGISEIYENTFNVKKKQDSVPIYIIESTVFYSSENLNVVYISNIDLNNLSNKNIKLVNNYKSNENNLKKLKQDKKVSKQLPYQLPNCKIKVAMAFTTTSLSNTFDCSKFKSSAYLKKCFIVINKCPIEKHPITSFYNSIKSNLLDTKLFNKPPPFLVAC
jgi:hypothetical protein